MVFNSIAYLIANMFWMYIIFRFYRCFFELRCENTTLLFTFFLLYLLNSSLHLLFHHPLLNLCSSLFGLYMIALNYTSPILQKCLVTALIYILSMICDLSVAIGFHTYYPGLKLSSIYTFIAYFLLLILQLSIERMIHFKKRNTIKTSHWVALIAVPMGSVFILCITVINPYKNRWMTLSTLFILLFINLMIFYLYDSIQHVYIKELRQSFLNTQLQAYKEQLEIMIQSQSRIHSLQHDLKHHLNTIDTLACHNKTDEIATYIRKMRPFIQQSETMTFTPNPVINGMLNYMLKDAKNSLFLDIQIVIPDEIITDFFDISIILGNLLDNALREALRSREKQLSIHMDYDKGLLHLFIKNSYCGQIIHEKGLFKTTQTDDEPHGIGISNVKAVVEKYQGLMEFYYDDHVFSTDVLLYMSNI